MRLLLSEAYFPHFLAALVLIARVGDVASTFVASPRLLLEANPLMRRMGRPLALATLLLCLVPYYYDSLGMVVLSASLLVTSSNLAKGWLMRALGEVEYHRLLLRAFRASTLRSAL